MPKRKSVVRKDKRSKTQKLLAHLQRGRTITGEQAMRRWGLYRLSSAIHRLRNKGYNIVTQMVDTGEYEYARYKMVDKP